MKILEQTNCPICNSAANALYSLEPTFIKATLEEYFDIEIKDDIDLIHYTMMQCSNCTLTFSSPLKEGSNNFYSWITRQKDYYPKDRWEYHKLYEILNNDQSAQISLLDVGCGSGEFLALLKSISKVRTIGVDTTLSSVEECRSKDLQTYCMDLNRFTTENPHYKGHFDYVVTFHCLEHIGKPLEFMRSMLAVLKPGGGIFVSTPYSPMSFETDWFDPLNHPPHHMGRWNGKAYAELGKQLNMDVKFHMPAAFPLLKRAMVSFLFSKKGLVKRIPRMEFFKLVMKHPGLFYKHLTVQRNRDKINGQAAAEVILVEFRSKSLR